MASSVASNIKLDLDSQVVEEIELNAVTIVATDRDAPLVRPDSLALETAEGFPRARKLYETFGFASILFFMFTLGWNDGTQGPLLPAIQAHYHVCIVALYIGLRTPHAQIHLGWLHHRINYFRVLLHSRYS